MSGETRDRWQVKAVERVLFALARAFEITTRPVPLWALEGALGQLGGLLSVLLPVTRNRAGDNLDLVWPDMPPETRREVIRAAGEHFVRLMVEYAHFRRFARDVDVTVDGLAHLTGAPRGAILVSAHYGNWEAARIAARRHGIECGIIYRAFNNRYLDRHTLSLITDAGEPVLQKGRAGMRRLVGLVAKGGTVMILVDQRNTGAPEIPFLGVPAETVAAAAELSLRTGALLIPVVARRNVETRSFEVTFEAPVTGTDPVEMMAEVNRRISRWIEREPGQWLWFHRRWKRVSQVQRPGS